MRPLSLKDGSNKTIAGAANYKIKAKLGSWAAKEQRGFIPHRSLVANVPILDAAALIFGLVSPQTNPCLVFFDFMAAFPSTSWRWIFFLLERSGIPTGLINLVKALYTQVAAHSAESRERLFWILSGILQGCPLSGSLFIIAINPMLLALRQLSPDSSRMVLTACADDIGIVLRSIELAPQIAALFDRFAALATLKLKAEKCVIVPVAIADAEAFKA